jgi:hypothetical protein
MVMLTIYSTLKNFTNEHTRIVQTNAVKSWLKLEPTPEVFIMGGDESVKSFCEELNITHVDVKQSEYGVPYLNDMMYKIEDLASNDFLLLVSGDIILFQETIAALNIAKNRLANFCLCSIKQESSVDSLIEFKAGWEIEIKKSAIHYSLPTSGDFFLYPKKYFLNSIPGIPDFIIGRSSCDSWLIKKAFEADVLVNATDFIPLIHQRHDYSHITLVNDDSPEYRTNLSLAEDAIGAKINKSNWFLNKDNGRLTKNVEITCPLDNIYHICGPRTASQWFKNFYDIIREFIGMSLCDFEIERHHGWDYRPFNERFEDLGIDKKVLVCPFYLSYENFLNFPKNSENYKSICVIRDPRDQLISFYNSVRYSHPQIGFHPKWRARLEAHENNKESIIEALKIMKEFGIIDAMDSYKHFYDDPKCLVFKYRDLFGNEQFAHFRHLVDWLEIPISYAELGQVLVILNFKNMACSRDCGKEDKFAHYRKGIPDDWKNYFDEDLSVKFEEIAGNIITNLRYNP